MRISTLSKLLLFSAIILVMAADPAPINTLRDAKLGRDGDHAISSRYELITAPPSKTSNPIGGRHTARSVVRGKRVEHRLNEQKVAEYGHGSPAFWALVAQSKFKNIPDFGGWTDAYLVGGTPQRSLFAQR